MILIPQILATSPVFWSPNQITAQMNAFMQLGSIENYWVQLRMRPNKLNNVSEVR